MSDLNDSTKIAETKGQPPADAPTGAQESPRWLISGSRTETHKVIVRIVNKVLYDPEERDEAVQQTWLRLLTAREQRPLDPARWISTIARNEAKSIGKAAKKFRSRSSPMDEESIELQGPMADTSHSDADRRAIEHYRLMWRVLFEPLDDDGSKVMWTLLCNELDEDQRRFLELSKAKLTIPQIAVAMRVSVPTVYRLREQLIAVLRALVAEPEDDPPDGPAGPGRGRHSPADAPSSGPTTTAVTRAHARDNRALGDLVRQQFLELFSLPAFTASERGTPANVGDEGPHFSELFDLPAFDDSQDHREHADQARGGHDREQSTPSRDRNAQAHPPRMSMAGPLAGTMVEAITSVAESRHDGTVAQHGRGDAFEVTPRPALRLVETQVALATAPAADDSGLAALAPAARSIALAPRRSPDDGSPLAEGRKTSAPTISAKHVAAPARGRSRRLVAVWLGTAAVAAAVALVAMRQLNRAQPTVSVAAVATASTSPLALREGPTPPTATAATQDAVNVTISAQPSEAQVLIDGQKLGKNPFRGSFARDNGTHRVSVSAPGYEPEEHVVSFGEDVNLVVKLSKSGSSLSWARRAPPPPPSAPPKGAKAAPDAPVRPPPPTNGRPPGTPAGDVDDVDPYAKLLRDCQTR